MRRGAASWRARSQGQVRLHALGPRHPRPGPPLDGPRRALLALPAAGRGGPRAWTSRRRRCRRSTSRPACRWTRGEEPEALRLDDHHELDLEPAIRDAISLAEPIAPLCRPDCPGLCRVCGPDLAADPAHAHPTRSIDPRLAVLAGPARRTCPRPARRATTPTSHAQKEQRSPMGVPKRRVSSTRQARAPLASRADRPQLEECPHCHQPKRSHHACPNCGWYGGREAVKIREKKPSEQGA